MLAHSAHSPNYDYVLAAAVRLAGKSDARILDFGCGQGQLVALGRQKGVDIYGADTFEGGYQSWADKLDQRVRPFVGRIEDGRLPFPDAHFDVVVSNQVFEHIADPPPALAEIHRVLKPGGTFLALFPTTDVWFEEHLGVYFVHWMSRWPELQRKYLHGLRRLGFGYYGAHLTPDKWAEHVQKTLHTMVWYHSWRDVRAWWRNRFGEEPSSCAADYMRFRCDVHPRLRAVRPLYANPVAAPLLAFVCHRRAGRVIEVKKAPR